jgi:tetratricopeptide (TPR) repeat protein
MPKIKRLFQIGVSLLLFIALQQAEALPKTDDLQDKLKAIEADMLRDGAYKKAVKELEALVEGHPRKARIYQDLGIAFYGLMDYEKAERFLKEADKLDVKKEFKKFTSYAISNIGKNAEVLGRIRAASAQLESADSADKATMVERIADDHITVLTNLISGRYYYPAMATAHTMWLKSHTPYIPGIYKFSGDIYYSAMLYLMAERDYKKAAEEEPENAYLRQRLGDCLVAIGDFDRAQGYYDEAIALYKKEGLEDGDPKIQDLQRIRQAMPRKYADIDALLRMKRYGEAEAICKKKMSLNPGDYVAITQLGEIYWQQDKRRAAMKLFNRAIKLAPDFPTAHLFLGRGYFFTQKHKEAFKEFAIFKKKMRLLPDMDGETVDFYVSALHNISYYYSRLERYDKMAKECKKIIKLRPDDQIAHFNLAVCYYQHYRKLSHAYNELQRVIEIDYATRIADRAKFFIDYIRNNPDPRFSSDFSFIFDYD